MPGKPRGTFDLGGSPDPERYKFSLETRESPESQTIRLEIEKGDARDRRHKGWLVLCLSCAVALACIAVILSGRYAAENVARAFTLLTVIISAGAGYQVGKAGK